MPFAFWHSLVNLPPPESCIVCPKYDRQSCPTETVATAICQQTLSKCAWFRIRITAQKFDDPRPVFHGWFAAVFLPVSVSFFLQFEACPEVSLPESQFHPPLLEMLAKCSWQ